MTTTAIEDVRVPLHTRRPRPVRDHIDLIIVHATRGNAPPNAQYRATVNHFTASPDNGGWGPTADAVAGAQGEQAIFSRVGRRDAYRDQHGSFSAGYGSYGASLEYSADERAFAIEIAQSASLEAYTDAAIIAAANLVREVVQAHGIPLVRVEYWDQLRSKPVPRGFIGHEDTANGRKTGKSDPGPRFPWARFFELIGSPAAGDTYTVRAGDTLGAIALRYGVTVLQLQQWNGIANPNLVKVGAVLRVTAAPSAPPPPQPAGPTADDLAVVEASLEAIERELANVESTVAAQRQRVIAARTRLRGGK